MVEAISDTDPEAERVQLELLRGATVGRRLRLALSLSSSVVALSRDGLARRTPSAGSEEVGLRFVELHYGQEIAAEVRRHLLARR